MLNKLIKFINLQVSDTCKNSNQEERKTFSLQNLHSIN